MKWVAVAIVLAGALIGHRIEAEARNGDERFTACQPGETRKPPSK
jgi:hypothetical protein